MGLGRNRDGVDWTLLIIWEEKPFLEGIVVIWPLQNKNVHGRGGVM